MELLGGWFLLIMIAIGSLSLVFGIGKYREPTSPGAAVISLVLSGIFALIVWSLMQRWM